MTSSEEELKNAHFLGSEIPNTKPEDAFFHIIPVPLEKTVSYGGGARLGPDAILKASWQLEMWEGKSRPCDLGIHTYPTLDCEKPAAQVLENVAKLNQKVMQLNKFPITLGGEHTVTYGVLRGLIDAGVEDMGVIQIDAHADLRHAYEGDLLSHASVMKRIVEMDIPLMQLGIRAYCEEEIEARKKYKVLYRDANYLVPNNISHIEIPAEFPANVFFTLDIDGMDPSVFPSTGTPVPGGLGWYQTLGIFESVARQRNIVGFDVMEFAPIEGFHAYDFAAAMLTYHFMGIVQRSRNLESISRK